MEWTSEPPAATATSIGLANDVMFVAMVLVARALITGAVAVLCGCGTSREVTGGAATDGGMPESAALSPPEGGPSDGPPLAPVGQAVLLEGDPSVVDYGEPRAAIDAVGAATVVWQQRGNPQQIWSARYEPSGGWRPAQALDVDTQGAAPQVTVDGDGTATAGWVGASAAVTNVQISRFALGTGWSAPVTLFPGPGSLELGAAGPGHATALSVGYDSTSAQSPRTMTAKVRRFEPAVAWLPEEIAYRVAADAGANVALQQINMAIDGAGSVMALWSEGSPDREGCRLFFNRYDPGSAAWGEPSLVEPDHQCRFVASHIGAGRSGEAIVIYAARPSPTAAPNLMARRWTGGAWNGPDTLSSVDVGKDITSTLAVAQDGTAAFLWSVGGGIILAQHFVPSLGWRAAPFPASDLVPGYPIDVSAYGNGGAVAVWVQLVRGPAPSGGYPHVFYSRFQSSTGWSAVRQVDEGTLAASDPHVAANAAGEAVAVWMQGGAYPRVYATHLP